MPEIKATLIFQRADGKNAVLTVTDANPTLNETEINLAMDTILAENIFVPNQMELIKKVSAKLTSTVTQDFNVTI